MNNQKINELGYNELRSKCAELGLGGNGTKEELIEKLKHPNTEEKQSKPIKAKSAEVVDAVGKTVRVYDPEHHGDVFIEKAKTYVETRPKQKLEVKIIE